MTHRGGTVLAMDCVLAGAETHRGWPLNSIVSCLSEMKPSDLAKIPPSKLGQLLASSLDQSCHISQVSEKEKSILTAIGVNLIQYQAERLALAGFAYDFAIVKILGASAAGNAVRSGYLEVWESLPRQSSSGQAMYDLFCERSKVYSKAADEMFAAPEPALNPMAITFGAAISPHADTADLLMLGTLAVELFFVHLESAQRVFKQASLIQ